MKRHLCIACVALVLTANMASHASEPVVGASDPDALFTSPDPKLHTNKQVVYHILKDIVEAGHWELAKNYTTERYTQHNPAVPTGRDAAVKFFTEVLKIKPKPIAPKLKMKVISVVAEGDYVVIAVPRELVDPKDPNKKYTTTFFDMWRMKDGKADEHWDASTLDQQMKLE